MARTTKRLIDDTEEKKSAAAVLFGAPHEEMEDEEIEEMASEPDEFDIFVDVGDKLTKAGDRITYTIKRDGEFIAGAIKHPCSWDKIQRDYGGGTFQIIARSTNKGGYVKSQTRNVASPVTQDMVNEEASTVQGNSTTDLLMLLQAQKREEREEMLRLEAQRERERQERDERLERERKEREAELKESQNSTMLMMMKMMESQSAQTTTLLSAMLQGNNKKEPEINVEKLMNMMDLRMEKMIALVQGKDKTKDIDALKLIELQSQAEDRGYKRAMDLQAQAEKKAEELAELRESAAHPESEEKTSTAKMILEAVSPVVQTFMAAKTGIPALPPAPPMPQIPPQFANIDPNRVVGPAPIPQPKIVLPKAPVIRPNVPVVDKKKMLKDLIESTVVTEIGNDLSKNLLTPKKMNPEATADLCLGILAKSGITPEQLCSQYSVQYKV